MQPSHRQYSCVPSKIGNCCFCDELVAFGRAESERVAVAFERQKQLGAVVVLPLAGVHRAAPQAHDDRQMLDAHRALKFAGAAGGALERGFLRKIFAEQRLLRGGAEIVQIVRARPARSFWDRESCRYCWRDNVRCSGRIRRRNRPEARRSASGPCRCRGRNLRRRRAAEFAAKPPRERNTENGLSTRCRCLVCGISGRKTSSASVCAHHSELAVQPDQAAQVGQHQHENQQGDHAGFDTTARPATSGAR